MLACYDSDGNLFSTADNPRDFLDMIKINYLKLSGIYRSINNKTWYKGFFFLKYTEEPPSSIPPKPYYCIIDDFIMDGPTDAAEYLGVSRQAVDQAHKRKAGRISGKAVIWS